MEGNYREFTEDQLRDAIREMIGMARHTGANDAAVAEIVFRWSWNMMQRAYDYAKNETIND
jgi:uncharacterized protein YbjQ (UPF0145 family)